MMTQTPDQLLDALSKEADALDVLVEAARTPVLPSGAPIADAATLAMCAADLTEELKGRADAWRPLVAELARDAAEYTSMDADRYIEIAGRFTPAPVAPPDPNDPLARRETLAERLARETHAMLSTLVDGQELSRLEARYDRLTTDADALRAEVARAFEARDLRALRALRGVVQRPQVPAVVKADFAERLKTLELPQPYIDQQKRVREAHAKARLAEGLLRALDNADHEAGRRAWANYHAARGTVPAHVEAQRLLREARNTPQGEAERARKLQAERERRWARIQKRPAPAPVRLPGINMTVMPAH